MHFIGRHAIARQNRKTSVILVWPWKMDRGSQAQPAVLMFMANSLCLMIDCEQLALVTERIASVIDDSKAMIAPLVLLLDWTAEWLDSTKLRLAEMPLGPRMKTGVSIADS